MRGLGKSFALIGTVKAPQKRLRWSAVLPSPWMSQYKVHIDGFDQTDVVTGKGPGKRHNIFYFDDNANFNAMRWNDWKIHFAVAWDGWSGPREALNFPRLIHLRSDPYEEALESGLYARWFGDNLWLFVPAQVEVGKWLATFREFPPRQPTASFTIDRLMQQMQQMLQMRAMQGAAAGQQQRRPQ